LIKKFQHNWIKPCEVVTHTDNYDANWRFKSIQKQFTTRVPKCHKIRQLKIFASINGHNSEMAEAIWPRYCAHKHFPQVL
jgi:hypothetical protein